MLHDDKNMNEELAKDEVTEQALSRLTAAWDPQQQAVTDEEDREVREQLEALAMLAYGLDPVAPSASAEQRLLAAVNAAPTPLRRPAAAQESLPTVRRDPLDRTLQHVQVAVSAEDAQEADNPVSGDQHPGDQRLVGQGAESGTVVPFGRRPVQSTPANNFSVMALAAALAFCLIGLGYLYGQLNAKNAVIAVQKERLQDLPEIQEALTTARSQLRGMNERLAMVNTVAQQAYPMRRVANVPVSAGGEEAFGRVFVCGQHQKWYLTVSGLEPAPSDQNYHLWFMTDEGPVDAGVVEVEGGSAGLQDLNMPDDTTGFSLTLEPNSVGDQPQGRVILVGDSPVKL